MQRPTASNEPRPRGRPRKPDAEAQILAAAARLYGVHGWAGFNLDAVAKAAGVGKSTIYTRWKTADALLGVMIEQRWSAVSAIDTGDLRQDLLKFGQLVLTRYIETGGGVVRHLRRDMITYPNLAATIAPMVERITQQAIAILARGRDRGQLRQGVSLALASDMLLSAMESQAGRIAPDQGFDESAVANYVARVVRLLMDGIADDRA
jgi:AcrR family transcriptional regulator